MLNVHSANAQVKDGIIVDFVLQYEQSYKTNFGNFLKI